MGLDMYMYVRKSESVGHWQDDYKEKISGFYPPEFENLQNKIAERNFLSKDTMYQVGYWRKANAIHNWIVTNCAKGVDNCQEIYMSKSNLQHLLDTCKEVLSDHSKAEDLLPTKDGFFFGNLEYNEWYFKDLNYTVELLTDVLKLLDDNEKEQSFYLYYDVIYQASW